MDTQDNRKINTPIQSMVENAKKDSTVGPMIGSIIIIILILIGGLYFLSSLVSLKKTEIQVEATTKEKAETQQIEETAKQSTSDDVNSIEADIKATDIDALDKDFAEIEGDF